MTDLPTLQEYPDLRQWYQRKSNQKSLCSPSEELLFSTCEAMTSTTERSSLIWIEALNKFNLNTINGTEDFLLCQDLATRHNADLMMIFSDFCQQGLALCRGHLIFNVLRQSADVTGVISFRFLSAWTAFNTGQLKECINECEKVTNPFAPINTLLGQAFLGLGYIEEAILSFDVATSMAPTDILAWFQKAKAFHILDMHDNALLALQKCLEISPNNPEVALMVTIVANSPKAAEPVVGKAWDLLKPIMNGIIDIPDIYFGLINLCMRKNDRKSLAVVISGRSSETIKLSDPQRVKIFTDILRDLQTKSWIDLVPNLLSQVISPNIS